MTSIAPNSKKFKSKPKLGAQNEGNLGFRAINWIGIIEQLARNKAERSLNILNITVPEFTILNHFSHRNPPLKTINGIASALQQPQPNISKTVKKLLKKNLLSACIDPNDGRSKNIIMTDVGNQVLENAIAVLSPIIGPAFADWETEELQDFYEKLDKLKVWFDNNR